MDTVKRLFLPVGSSDADVTALSAALFELFYNMAMDELCKHANEGNVWKEAVSFMVPGSRKYPSNVLINPPSQKRS